MKQLSRELYGSLILFFYFLKWPIVIGYPLFIFKLGLHENYIIDVVWLVSLVLIFKDIYARVKKRK